MKEKHPQHRAAHPHKAAHAEPPPPQPEISPPQQQQVESNIPTTQIAQPTQQATMAFAPAVPGFGGFALDAASGALSLGTGGQIANPGGGQANAVPLPSLINRIATVGTAGDSVLLPVSNPGTQLIVANGGANSLNVFPQVGDQVNVLGVNQPFALAAAKQVIFGCSSKGQWVTILTA